VQNLSIERRGVGRERVWPGECTHTSPVLVERVGDDGHGARCLLCSTVGPVRGSSEEALEALQAGRY
jgi:hypothetical protein